MSKHIMELVGSLVDDAKVAGIQQERQRILDLIWDEIEPMTATILATLIERGQE